MQTVAFRSSSTAATGSSASLSIPVPAGTVAGDILILLVYNYKSGGGSNPTAPGFTVRAWSSVGSNDTWSVLTKTADGTEGANITISYASNSLCTAALMAYSGSSGVNVFAAAGSWQATATINVPSVTTTVPNAVLIGMLIGSGASATPTAGWTERVDYLNNYWVYAMDKAQAVAGASGTAGVPVTGGGGATWAYTIALTPASTPGVLGFDTKGSSTTSGSGQKGLSKFTLAAPATLTELHGWFVGFAGGVGSFILCIYSDVGGVPTTRLAYTSPLATPASATDVELSQAGFSVALAAGDYWIGWVSGTNNGSGYLETAGGTSKRWSGATFNPPVTPCEGGATDGARLYSAWAVVSAAVASSFVPQIVIS